MTAQDSLAALRLLLLLLTLVESRIKTKRFRNVSAMTAQDSLAALRLLLLLLLLLLTCREQNSDKTVSNCSGDDCPR